MKVVFADSFFESLERMRRHQTWWYKTYEFFRYNLPYFFRNIWSFRRELYRFRSWDYQFNQDLFSRSLELAADGMEKYGREVDETRLKKVAMMRRAAALLRNREDEIYEIVDKEKPFSVVPENEEAIRRYMNSRDYWANQYTFIIVTELFGLSIIVLDYGSDGTIKCSNIDLNKDSKPDWDKYFFMFRKNEHYECIRFNQHLVDVKTNIEKAGEIGSKSKTIDITKIIFDKNNRMDKIEKIFPPPFYIFYLIYATYYASMVSMSKNDIVIGFKNIMEIIQKSFMKIANILDEDEGVNIFNDYIDKFNKVFKVNVLEPRILKNMLSTSTEPANNTMIEEIINVMSIVQTGGAEDDDEKEKKKLEKMKKKERDSNLSYYVTIDIELKKGTTLTKEELVNIQCRTNWNSIRRSYADLTDQKYVIPPVYDESKGQKQQPQTKKGGKRQKINRKTRKNRN
jgi:hypothetical protein